MNAKWLCLAGLVFLSGSAAARVQTPPPSALPAPSFEGRLAKRAEESRHAVSYQVLTGSRPSRSLP